MTDLLKLVAKNLEDSGADKETIELWTNIEKWYNEGGPDRVNKGVTAMMNEIKKVANKQIKETKQIIKQKKKRKSKR